MSKEGAEAMSKRRAEGKSKEGAEAMSKRRAEGKSKEGTEGISKGGTEPMAKGRAEGKLKGRAGEIPKRENPFAGGQVFWRKRILIGVLAAFTVFFLIQFFRTIDFGAITLSFQNTRRWALLITFGCYVAMNLLRTRRLYEIFDRKVSFPALITINASYNALNHIIPYRIGELTLPYFLHKEDAESYPFNKTLGALIYMRIFDFAVSGIGLFGFVLGIYRYLSAFWLFFGASVIVFGISVLALVFLMKISKVPDWLARIQQRKNNRYLIRISAFLKKVALDLQHIRDNFNHRKYLLYALGIRLLQVLITVLVFYALHIEIPLYMMILLDLFMAFVEIIPLSLIANFGYYEFSYAALLDVENIPTAPYSPYEIGFLQHFYNILFILAYFGLGQLNRLRYKEKNG